MCSGPMEVVDRHGHGVTARFATALQPFNVVARWSTTAAHNTTAVHHRPVVASMSLSTLQGVGVRAGASSRKKRADVSLGQFAVDETQLLSNVIALRYAKGGSIVGLPRVRVSDAARRWLVDLLSGQTTNSEELSDQERDYLAKVVSRSQANVSMSELFGARDGDELTAVQNAQRRLVEAEGEWDAGDRNVREEVMDCLATLLRHHQITTTEAERVASRYRDEE